MDVVGLGFTENLAIMVVVMLIGIGAAAGVIAIIGRVVRLLRTNADQDQFEP